MDFSLNIDEKLLLNTFQFTMLNISVVLSCKFLLKEHFAY